MKQKKISFLLRVRIFLKNNIIDKKKYTIEELQREAKIYDTVKWSMFFISVCYLLILIKLEIDINRIISTMAIILLLIPFLGHEQRRLKNMIVIRNLKKDFEQHKALDKDSIRNNIIMNWEGQNNVLTDMFRQAKNRGYLTNSIPEIASFLKDNFSCFEKTKLSTIETQLKNNNSSANAIPKDEKRIKLEE